MSFLDRSKLPLVLALALVVCIVILIVGCGREPGPVAQSEPVPVTDINEPNQQEDASDSQDADKSKDKSDQEQSKEPKPEEDSGPKLEFSQKGITLKWVENGQLRMSATAKELKGDEVTKTGTLLDFSAKLYENGKLTASMHAPKAFVDTANRVVTATGGVTLESVERETKVKSDWVKWYAKQQKVVGNGGVRIDSAMGTIEAAAFVANTALKSLTVMDSAEGLKQ